MRTKSMLLKWFLPYAFMACILLSNVTFENYDYYIAQDTEENYNNNVNPNPHFFKWLKYQDIIDFYIELS